MLVRREDDDLLSDFMSCFDHYWEDLVERPPLPPTGSELLSADALPGHIDVLDLCIAQKLV